MPTVQGIGAKARQIARPIVGKVMQIAAKARPSLIVGKASLIVGKVRQIAASQMGVAKPIAAKTTVGSGV
jgi:hypothetical protein